MLLALRQQLFGSREWITHGRGVIYDHVPFAGRFIHHEAATNRVIDPCRQHLTARIVGREAHTVRMKGQRFCAMHDQVGAIIKGYGVPRQQRQGALLPRSSDA